MSKRKVSFDNFESQHCPFYHEYSEAQSSGFIYCDLEHDEIDSDFCEHKCPAPQETVEAQVTSTNSESAKCPVECGGCYKVPCTGCGTKSAPVK